MDEQYKIILCTPALCSAGGVERVVSVKADYIADFLNYDVTIIVTEGNGSKFFLYLSPNVEVVNLGLRFEGDPTLYVKMLDNLSIDKKRCHLYASLVMVEDKYLKSSILVQPSRTESFGLVIETTACGLPVVAYDCENDGVLLLQMVKNIIPAFDVDMFANRLKLVMN